MSNWLGFSLAPHLRVGGDAGEEEGTAADAPDNGGGGGFPVMPLGPDGTFSVLDSKHCISSSLYSSILILILMFFFFFWVVVYFWQFVDWRYDNDMNGPNTNEEAPKFEDFLGCCYSNSPPSNEPGEINMNAPPNFSDDLGNKTENFTNPSLFFQPYHYGVVPTGAAANPDGVYPSPFAGGRSGATTGSGFKSWLQETDKPVALSLTVSPSSQPDAAAALPLQAVADGKKRVAKSSAVKEPVPRKSIDTFGQRTSQYRGVTRYKKNHLFK